MYQLVFNGGHGQVFGFKPKVDYSNTGPGKRTVINYRVSSMVFEKDSIFGTKIPPIYHFES